METFYDIYQNYLQNPYGEINALSQVNPSPGIMNTNTISPTGGDSMGVSPVASINTNPNVTNTAPRYRTKLKHQEELYECYSKQN
jgi:hypothetical protein